MIKKKYRYTISVLFLALFLAGSIAQAGTLNMNVTAHHNAGWVVMFYQCGDNRISSAIDICLDQIERVGATDEVKIAVLLDKRPLNDTTLYYYDGTTPVAQEWPAESDLSDADTLIAFTDKVMQDYPADNYCLEITANKGSGWQGICYDDHGDDLMITMPELFDALDVITENGCFKLDVLLIQTCLGGSLEFRYQVRQFCHYFVGYADCGLIGDIPFDEILADAVADPSMSAEQFSMAVVDHFTPQQYQNIYQSMGATDSTRLDSLADSINAIAELLDEHSDIYGDAVRTALEATRKYGLQFNIDYYVDLTDFLEHLSIDDAEFTEAKDTLFQAIDEAVIAKVTLDGYPSCGFNLYFPDTPDDYNDALRYAHALPSPYEETLFAEDTHWDEFLKGYLGLASNTAPDAPAIEGPDRGASNEQHEYRISADDPEADELSFYIDWGDGTYEMDGPVSSGEELSLSHTWTSDGTYEVSVKAIDQYGAASNWATLEVSMPLTHPTLLEIIMEWILYLFGIAPHS